MHACQLFGTVDDRSEADDVVADILVETGIGGTGHDIGTDRKSGECLFDAVSDELECFSVDNRCFGDIHSMEDFRGKTLLFCPFAYDGKAFVFALVGNEAHVSTKGGFLRHDIVGIGSGLHRKGDGRL